MPTVLVVDDGALDRALAGACIKEHGYQPLFAENGRQALESIARDKPDFVLTDMQMPELDGLQLVRAIRKDHPSIPVIVMTAHGSEDIAVEALKLGAASYVPKRSLRERLKQSLRVVENVARAMNRSAKVRSLLEYSEHRFVIGNERDAPMAIINYLVDGLRNFNFCDDGKLIQITTALAEALTNAIDHGNLELDSKLREGNDYRDLGDLRRTQPPYCHRRVFVTARLVPTHATYIIRDEGPGFDPSQLPDPRDPENVLMASGRGVMLIRTFMDEVRFNATGNEITMVIHSDTAARPAT